MRKHRSRAFRPTTLTYSSPAVGTTSIVPNVFYNAFPDLNDLAPDESRSAFPRRAKYNLPLDSMLLPSAMWVDSNSIAEDYLASVNPTMREAIDVFTDRFGHHNLKTRLPRKPELDKAFYVEALSEVPHKRLAATEYKWTLRTYYVASFYTTLENHLVRGQTIKVPLVPSYRGSQLQRHLAAVNEAFRPTQLIDEAVSLLVCVTLLPTVEAQGQEQAWERAEEAENPGFIAFYRKLRDEFNPDSCTTATARSALAERIIEYAKESFYARTVENVSVDRELLSLDKPEKDKLVSWPSLFGEEVHCGVPQLRVRRKDILPGRAAAQISIPEAMQWFLARFCFVEDDQRDFTIKDPAWADYLEFFLEGGEDIAGPSIGVMTDLRCLQNLAHLYFKKADGSKLNWNPKRTPADTLIADSIAQYTILLESIRQQVCTGVGLCCPFWKGSGCCKFRPILQRTYDVCKPWGRVWKCHWQRPPCLLTPT